MNTTNTDKTEAVSPHEENAVIITTDKIVPAGYERSGVIFGPSILSPFQYVYTRRKTKARKIISSNINL